MTDSNGNSGVDTSRGCEMLDRNAMSAVDYRAVSRRVALTLIVAGYFGLCCLYPRWMELMGIGRLKVWFADTHAVLAASDAHALGVSPDIPNPLDLIHQPHTYSDWWFGLHSLHLTRGDYLWLGATMGFLFLVVAISQVRARSWGEIAWSALLLCSPPVVFAFNRGNVDLLVFVTLSALAPCLLARHATLRWFGIAIVFVATAMKFYPVLAGVLLIAPTRSRREIQLQIIVLAMALVAFALSQIESAHRYFSGPLPSGFFTFGVGVTGGVLGAPLWLGTVAIVALGGAALAVGSRVPAHEPATPGDELDRLKFILGAVVIVGCYFTTVNYLYRAICVVWMAPFLWTGSFDAAAPRIWRTVARATAVLLVVLLWFDAIVCVGINVSRALSESEVVQWTNRLVLLEQPIVAALMLALLVFVVMFVRHALRTEIPVGTNTPWIPESEQLLATARTAPVNHAGLAAIAGLGYMACVWWPKLLQLLGIDNLGIWFLDMEGALAATDASRQGLPALGGNPLDVFHRPHLYSRWWHALGWLGLTRADYLSVGLFVGCLFLVVAVLLLCVRSRLELLWSAAFILAPPMLFAFDRGNADLIIFVILAAAVPLLLSSRTLLRWLSLAVILFGAGLKWYPALAGILLLAPTRSRKEIISQVLVFAALVGVLAVSQYHDLRFNLQLYNSQSLLPGFHLFGVGVTAELLQLSPAWTFLLATALALVAIAAWRWAPTVDIPETLRAHHLGFIVGVTLLVGCYFLTINYTYRAVFAIFAAPFLWSASTSVAPRRLRRLSRFTGTLLVAWLWSDGFACILFNTAFQTTQGRLDAWSRQFVLAQQPLVFLLIAALLVFVVMYARHSIQALFHRDDIVGGSVRPAASVGVT